uniref:TGF-beta family profile domain-containing protein n=1 Tax=Electrophorus electricus TaxID=8005 RepID=A0A4W4HTN2_ELEEL
RRMRSVLKLTMLLVCVQAGEGHWLHTLLGKSKGHDPHMQMAQGGEGRARRSFEEPCALHTILLRVSDLGLGYNSDEMVLFKYCSGACPRLPSNHDLTLASLQHSGALRSAMPSSHSPCCRPTHHEDIAFLDNANRWHKVEKLSAAACTCLA